MLKLRIKEFKFHFHCYREFTCGFNFKERFSKARYFQNSWMFCIKELSLGLLFNCFALFIMFIWLALLCISYNKRGSLF